MSIPDLTSIYILMNAYTLDSKNLASFANASIFMDDASDAEDHQWYLSSTDIDTFYRLHTLANGDSKALDVLNDNDVQSTTVRFSATGRYAGQYWRFDNWGDGTLRLSNNFTGPDKHLDTYADTLEAYLSDEEASGQHWTFSKVGDLVSSATQVSSTSIAETSSSSASSASILPAPHGSSATKSQHPAISGGAIAGIVIGGLVAIALCICAVIFFLRSRRVGSARAARQQTPVPPVYPMLSEKGTALTVEGSHTGQYQPPVELGGGAVQSPVEMPSQRS